MEDTKGVSLFCSGALASWCRPRDRLPHFLASRLFAKISRVYSECQPPTQSGYISTAENIEQRFSQYNHLALVAYCYTSFDQVFVAADMFLGTRREGDEAFRVCLPALQPVEHRFLGALAGSIRERICGMRFISWLLDLTVGSCGLARPHFSTNSSCLAPAYICPLLAQSFPCAYS